MERIDVEFRARTLEALTQEAADRGYRNPEQYVRHLVLHRGAIVNGVRARTDSAHAGSLEAELDTVEGELASVEGELVNAEVELSAQLNELKQRVVALEAELAAHRSDGDAHADE
jgi:hypothetical protein